MTSSTITLFIIMGVLALYLIAIFNRLVVLNNRYKNAFAQIEVQLKRRHDLIPALVAVAKEYMDYERETLEAIIAARDKALTGLSSAHQAIEDGAANISAIRELGQAESVLSHVMGRFKVVVEDYPELKADKTMLQLSEELSHTENKVSFARQAFNDQVTFYNIFKQSFPQNLLANVFGHKLDAPLLEFDDSEQIQAPPKVSF